MKFRLYVKKNGEDVQWVFDNETSIFYDENGQELLADLPHLKHEQIYPFTRNFNPYIKSTDNTLLEIVLGNRCNFHCKYCSQTLFRGQCYDSKPSDVAPFIQMLKESGLKCRRIQLWGGEPLVYWKTIELLVPELRKMFPEAHISAPSNGSLLTREKVDFYKKYNMYLYISHDGCANNLGKREANSDNQKSDVLQDPVVLDAIQYAKTIIPNQMISFGTTPTTGNTDCEKIIQFFQDTVGPNTNASTHNIVRCHNSADRVGLEASKISQEELDRYSDSVFKVLNSGNPNDYSLRRRRDDMINTIIARQPLTSIRAECSIPFPDGMVVDMKGQVLQCHNHAIQDQAYGQLPDLNSVHALGYSHLLNRKRCRECLVVHGCKGGCPSADELANEVACPNLKAMYWGIFRGAVASLFGVYLYKYEKIE